MSTGAWIVFGLAMAGLAWLLVLRGNHFSHLREAAASIVLAADIVKAFFFRE